MAHSFFDQLCENLTEGVLICDGDGQVLHANRVAQASLTQNLDWLTSRPLDTWLRGRDGRLWPESRASLEREAFFEDISGERVSCRLQISPLPVMGSQGWIVILRENLVASHRLAGLEALVGGIARRLSKELETILDQASSALLENSDTANAVPLRAILEAGQNAAILKRQLRAITGEGAQLAPIQLEGFVADTAPLMASLLGEKATLQFALDSEQHWIQADSAALRLALVHLSEWLSKNRGGVPLSVEIETRRSTEKPAHICLNITENEEPESTITGISPESFLHPSSPHKDLAIVFGIVEQLDGRMLVHVSDSGNHHIHLEFPECPAADREEAEAQVANGTETILVVDDDPSTIEVVSQLLRDQGFDVLTATNGTEASVLIQNQHKDIDILLTDAVLPGRSGLELISEMRAIAPEMPVLLMSGYPAEFMGGQVRPDIPLLGKPFSPGTLINRLRNLIDAG